MSETLDRVRALVAGEEILISAHGYDELNADGILATDALNGLAAAVVVEDYPDCRSRTERSGAAEGCARPHSCIVGDTKGPHGAGRIGDGVSARSGEMECGFHPTEGTMSRKSTKIIREGKFAAEVSVDLIEDDGGWSPYLSVADAEKLDSVRKALRAGDVRTAARLGRVFELLPVSG